MRDVVIVDGEPEKKFATALFNFPAIKTMDKEKAINHIGITLGYWCKVIGLKENQIPDGQNLLILAEWIIGNYSFLTTAEIKHAIDISITGQLGEVNLETYGNTLHIQFVSKVLNAYKFWRSDSLNKIQAQTEKYVYANALPPPPPTPAEEAELMKEMITNEYKRYQLRGTILDFNGYIWNYLKANKIISLTKEQQLPFIKKGEDLVKARPMRTKKPSNLTSLGEQLQKDYDIELTDRKLEIAKLGRRFALADFFERTPLEDIISKVEHSHFVLEKP